MDARQIAFLYEKRTPVVYLHSMRNDKNRAVELRKAGRSYREICSELSIPKSTLSDWFGHQDWSKNISKKLSDKAKPFHIERILKLNAVKKIHLTRLYAEARSKAMDEFKFLKNDPLFLVAMSLYWGEGDKASNGQVRISNSDPMVIEIFLLFLREICHIPNSRMWLGLVIYPDINTEVCESYWSKSVKLNRDNFHKTVIIHGRHKSKKLAYGTASAGISSRFLKEKMLVWLELLGKNISQNANDH